MRKFLWVLGFVLLAADAGAQSQSRKSPPRRGAACCDASQLATIADLNYEARVKLGHVGPVSERLYALNMAIAAGTWQSFVDPNRAELIAALRAGPGGAYWSALIDSFAAAWGTPVAPAPAPPPVPAPRPPAYVLPPAPAGCPPPPGKTILTAKLATCLAWESSRVNALLAIVNGLPAGGGASSVANTVNGDLVVNGRICIQMQCEPAKGALLQMTGQYGAGILVFSNANGLNDQGAERHCSELTWSPDGGMRMEHNVYYADAGMVWCEPAKPRTILGFDSQGTLSLSQDYNGVIDPSQVAIFSINRERNFAAWTLMKPNMKQCIGWSNGVNDYANLWCPASGNSARRPVGVAPPANTTKR